MYLYIKGMENSYLTNITTAIDVAFLIHTKVSQIINGVVINSNYVSSNIFFLSSNKVLTFSVK